MTSPHTGIASAEPASRAPAAHLTWKTVLVWIVGSAAFALFLSRSGVSAALPLLRRLTPETVAAVLLLSAAVPVLKLLRWHVLLAACGVHVARRKLLVPVSAGFFWGLVTPGTSGEVSRGFLLGIARRVSVATVIYEKVYDSLALVGMAVGALVARLLYARTGSHVLEWCAGAATVGILLAAPCIVARRTPLSHDGASAEGTPIPGLRGRIDRLIAATGELARSPRITVVSAATSCTMWLLTGAQFVLLVRVLGAPAFPWTGMGLGFFVPYIAGIVSLVPLGLGVLELTVSTLLAHYYSVGAPTAHATALAFRIVVTLPFVLWGFACYSFQALQARRRRIARPPQSR